jgi:hypothetical protein
MPWICSLAQLAPIITAWQPGAALWLSWSLFGLFQSDGTTPLVAVCGATRRQAGAVLELLLRRGALADLVKLSGLHRMTALAVRFRNVSLV